MDTALPDLVRDLLAAPLPAQDAQLRMAPRPRRDPADDPRARLTEAAVLLLLYPVGGEPYLVLTARPETLERHSGQVSLPGGAREQQETPEENALRETREELGVCETSVRILGTLTPLPVHASGFLVHPVVGWAERRPSFKADPAEVAEIIEVPIAKLIHPETVATETWVRDGAERIVPFFLVNGHKVWGATAMILSEFLAVLSRREGGLF